MKRLILAAAALAVPVIATSAQAASLLSIGSNNIKFQNFEAVFHAGTGIEEASATYTPVAGDYIVGIAQITTINSKLQDGTLTGVFVQQVKAGPLGVPGVPLAASDRNTFTDLNGNPFTVNINNLGGEIFRFYENPTNTFNAQTTTLQQAFNSVQGSGFVYLSLGETGPGVNNPSNTPGYEYSLLGVGGLVAKTFAGFNLLVNNTGLVFSQVNDPNESTVSGGALGDSPTNPSPIVGIDGIVTRNDAYFQSDISQNTIGSSLFTLQSADPAFLSAVPAPASVWGGLVLLGALGAVRVRKVLA